MAEAAKWYVVHTYSGYENTVKATIEKTIETRQLQDLIHVVSIPMETVTEITDNGPKTYDRKVFPGYVLVKMIMTDEAWYIIKNVRGVTGFVGSGTKPTPLTDEEVQQLGVEKHEIVVAYSEGDTVKIADGPLTSFTGVVDMVDIEKNKVRVCASTSVSEIKNHSVVVSGKFNEEIECDTVVISIGHTPNTALADELIQAGYDVRIIGDAVKVGLVGPAVRAGYLTARQI